MQSWRPADKETAIEKIKKSGLSSEFSIRIVCI